MGLMTEKQRQGNEVSKKTILVPRLEKTNNGCEHDRNGIVMNDNDNF